MNREKEIEEIGIPLMEPRFLENIENISREFETNKEQIMKHFLDSFDQAFQRAIKLKEQWLKGDIDYICLFYLKSSILTKSDEFLIELYDDQFYADGEEASAVWVPEFIMKYYRQDLEYFQQMIKTKVIRAGQWELEAFEIKLAGDYYKIAAGFFAEHIEDIMELESFSKLDKTDSFKIQFGGLYEEGVVLYEAGKEEVQG